jgi:hypothetical protein
MAYGRWYGVRGAQNEEETEGILTKGFTTKGRDTCGVLPCFRESYLSLGCNETI